jgi:UDP-galactopyranose mutase
MEDPADQASIPHPRLGFYGVIDERMDLALLSEIADMQPNWHLVLVGPVTKIELDMLPSGKNIHYLGGKTYDELPTYLSGWDVALLPFVRNESTRFISPTKTPEYLAGGKPVVSTSIHDVVFPYGKQGLVYIADTASDFVAAVKEAMNRTDPMHLQKVDTFLSQTSWDRTWNRMRRLIDEIVVMRQDLPSYAVALRSSQSILHANLSSSGGLE